MIFFASDLEDSQVPIEWSVLAELLASRYVQNPLRNKISQAINCADGLEGVRCRSKCEKTGFQCYKWAGHRKKKHDFPQKKIEFGKPETSVILADEEDASIESIVLYSLLSSEFWQSSESRFQRERRRLIKLVGDDGIHDVRCRKVSCEGIRCTRNHFHKKSHRFKLPGALSRSYFLKLVDTMTDGQIKNLAGLDNIDVTKGYENFNSMEEIIKSLASKGGLDPSIRDKLLQKNRSIEAYHKTDFIDHLDTSSKHQCTCIQCGFHHETDGDAVPCETRSRKEHLGPCDKCYESIEFVGEMLDLYRKTYEKVFPTDGDRECTSDYDEFLRMEAGIKKYQTNLEDYRAHLVQKFWESKEDDEFFRNLPEGEAVVICDFKMKILAHFFREKMEAYFGKKGFSCIGFNVIFGSSTSQKRSQFYFMFSEDTKQDGNAVLSAKSLLYNEVLPKEGVRLAHWRSDGAQCFAQKLLKACMPLWKKWTKGKIDEISYKISVSGCGKTVLDCLFGVMTHAIIDMVKKGMSFTTAEQLFDMFAANPIQASHFILYAPDRAVELTTMEPTDENVKEILKKLTSQYHFKKVEDEGDEKVIGHKHSNLGKGFEYSIDRLEELVIQKKKPSDTVRDDDELDEGVNENEETCPAPSYFVLKSTYEPPRIRKMKGTDRFSTVHEDSFKKRKKIKLQNRRERNNEAVAKKIEDKRKKMREKGLHLCTAQNEFGDYCTKSFTFQSHLDEHMSRGNHDFPPINSICRDVRSFTDRSKAGFKNGLGTRVNRNDEYRSKETVADNPNNVALMHPDIDFSRWTCTGCYCTRRAKPKRYTEAMKDDLLKLFKQGEEGGQKVTAQRAYDYLRGLTMDDNSKRLKYSPDPENPNGDLITIPQIKSWFSIQARKKEPEDGNKKPTLKQIIADLKKFGLPVTEKPALCAILKLDDPVGDYSSKNVNDLKKICVDKKLFGSVKLTKLVILRALLEKQRLVENNCND